MVHKVIIKLKEIAEVPLIDASETIPIARNEVPSIVAYKLGKIEGAKVLAKELLVLLEGESK